MELSFIITILTAIVAMTVVLITLMFFYERIKRRHKDLYDKENMQSQLTEIRLSLETKLYELSDRLLSTEERWKDVQHLILSSQNRQPDFPMLVKAPHLSQFLSNLGLKEKDLKIEQDLVFVLTPFHRDKRATFDTIVDVCRGVGLKCFRGDEEFIRGEVLPHIIRLMAKARIIVANIEGRNPNVLYELGIAHAIDKPTIIISKSPVKAPFDIKAKHLVIYRDEMSLRSELKEALTRALVKA